MSKKAKRIAKLGFDPRSSGLQFYEPGALYLVSMVVLVEVDTNVTNLPLRHSASNCEEILVGLQYKFCKHSGAPHRKPVFL